MPVVDTMDLRPFATAPIGVMGADARADAMIRTLGLTVVHDDHVALAVDDRGSRRWMIRATPVPGTDGSLTAVVDASVTVVTWNRTRDPRPGRLAVRAIDTRTGRELWRDDTASFATAVAGRVYLSRCGGSQNGRLGNCSLVARDARTGGRRWAVDEYAGAQVEVSREVQAVDDPAAPAAPQPVVVHSYPRNADASRYRAHASSTGAPLGGSLDIEDLTQIGTVAVTPVGEPRAAQGCRQVLAGIDLATGQRRWTRTVPLARTGGAHGPVCRAPVVQRVAGTLIAIDGGGPILVDAATGRTVWERQVSGYVTGVAGSLVLVDVRTAPNAMELSAFDDRTGRVRWTRPVGEPMSRGRVDGGRLLIDEVNGNERSVLVLDAGTGRRLGRASGRLVGSGPGWFGTQPDGGSAVVRVFRLP